MPQSSCRALVLLILIFTVATGLPQQASLQIPHFARRPIDNVWAAAPGAYNKNVSAASTSNVLTSLTPNDPGYDATWGNVLDVPNMLGEIQQRMSSGLTPETVYVAIMDGTLMSHPDLDPLHATQYDRDFTGTPPGDTTLGSHASGVASIASARTHNGIGAASVAGFSGSVKFFSVRIFDTNGTTTLQQEIEAFNYIGSLVTQGVPVVAVACAFGAPGSISTERDAIKALTDKGVVVFAGGGTKGADGFYPASYSETNAMVVPVSSLTADGSGLASDDFSAALAPGAVAIAAPTNVKVVVRQSQPDQMATFGGVSAATSQPAAAYALVRSIYPSLSPTAALRRLGFSTLALTGTRTGKLNPYLAATNRVFLVGSPIGTTKAVAVDALTHTVEPFGVRTRYFTTQYTVNEATRLMLFAYNLAPTTPPSSIAVRVTDLNDAHSKSLTVESISAFSDMPFLASVTVLLRDDLASGGDVRIRLSVNGIETDPVLVKIQ